MTKRTRVLSVDDKTLNIDVYQEVPTERCALKTAATGEEALEIIPRFRPDIILVDIMMPGMDG